MSAGWGVVAAVIGPMGEWLVRGGLEENGGKSEAIGEGSLRPVVGLDVAGGKGEFEETERGVARRETREEFGGDFAEGRFRRLLPDPIWVRQWRDGEPGRLGKLWDFSVTCYYLRVMPEEVEKLIKEGAVILDDPRRLRLRDRYIYNLARKEK